MNVSNEDSGRIPAPSRAPFTSLREIVGGTVLRWFNKDPDLRTPDQKRRLGTVVTVLAAGATFGVGGLIAHNEGNPTGANPLALCAAENLESDADILEAGNAVQDCALDAGIELRSPQLQDLAEETLVLIADPVDYQS